MRDGGAADHCVLQLGLYVVLRATLYRGDAASGHDVPARAGELRGIVLNYRQGPGPCTRPLRPGRALRGTVCGPRRSTSSWLARGLDESAAAGLAQPFQTSRSRDWPTLRRNARFK